MEFAYTDVMYVSLGFNAVLLLYNIFVFVFAGNLPLTLARAKFKKQTCLQIWRKDMVTDWLIPKASGGVYKTKYGTFVQRADAHWTLPNGVRTGIAIPDSGVMISPLDIVKPDSYNLHPMDIEGRIQEAENIARAEEARTFKPEWLIYAGIAMFILVMAYNMLSDQLLCQSVAREAASIATQSVDVVKGTGGSVGG